MQKHNGKRLLSLMLVALLCLQLAMPAAALGASGASAVTFEKVDNSAVSASVSQRETAEAEENEHAYADTDTVRVSIILEKEGTIAAGFSHENIALNEDAVAYRAELEAEQDAVAQAISKATASELDVVWNLTLATNIISANVRYGDIETIKAVAGVQQVLIETAYEPCVAEADGTADPNMATSSKQIGSAAAWAAGYTGAGSRIAVIDTGSDTDHQSLNAEAFEYSLSVLAEKAGMSYEEYVGSLDLLDAKEIASVADQLNAPVAEDAYINAKLPFGYNYIDKNLTVNHDSDSQGSHGSHVAGIATANAYIPEGDGFVSALSSAMVQGVAPDAQLITMKVFGKAGGAYPSDYMAAIEDAIVLGCDAANLSLGSGNPGMSRETTAEYQAILDSLTEAGIVVAMSAGNSGYWAENAYNAGYLYAEDVSMQTNGSPGSYTNSLSVASVDNDGKTGYAFNIGDLMIVYNELLEGNSGPYTNKSFTTIAGDHEYVIIDGVGTPEDWATVGDALEGKIALCSRGTTSFFEKATAAVDAGAIATFIYNNQAGVINMDLTDYKYTEPCASLTQADGAAVKAASTAVTDDAGNVLYYTGTMTIGDSMQAGQFNSDYYTMSSFSSWGVPGSLELKPEITAPGGSIYSINGVDKSGKAYETMSGTSMASPQVAGMAALVAQYIRENDLEAETGLTTRQLSQSLLMSTAVPMLASASAYHPVLQQGAGLANVGAAVSADSYITMADGSSAGAADGKVKVELGDDPTREGVYTATFAVNNMTDAEKTLDLGADFFIQAPISDGTYMYMYTTTALIGMDAQWTVDGELYMPEYNGRDFNGDGAVNSDDGQAILDYATGALKDLTNMELADIDADGDVDSYDAYLFLKDLNSAVAVLPASGAAEVTVTFTMSDDWKAILDYYYPNGTYIQGYIFAETVSSEEGVAGTSHSIPVLGFFGNWTEASMYDVGNAQVYATGEETRVPYLNKANANTFTVTYASEPGTKYIFGGNPLVADETYMPERNAINSADMIAGVNFALIRNAAASKFYAVNETTGEVLVEAYPGEVSSAYYYVNGSTWRDTAKTLNAQVDLTSASEGDVISMGLTMAPEYYVDAEGNVAWDALADGATFGTTMVIDNTAPVLEDVALSLVNNAITVEASDNEYIAAVALYNKAGTEVLAYTGAMQDIEKGETSEYTFSLEGVTGSKFLLQVMDYAMNTTTYEVELQMGDDVQLPDMIAFDLDYGYWTSLTTASTHSDIAKYADAPAMILAATIVDRMVLASDDLGNVYIMPENDLTDVTVIANCGTVLVDMAYSKADDTVYAVDQYGQLVTLDRLTAETDVVGEIGVATNTLACDENGNFYCNGYGTGAVYTFTLDTMAEPTEVIANVGIKSQYVQAMEMDPNTGKLYWTSYYTKTLYGYNLGYAYLYEIDVNEKTYTRYNDLWDELSALIIPSKTTGESWTAPTDAVTGLQLSAETASVLKGNTVALTANVLPWTASDRSVTWTSDNEAVATVDENGVVTGVSSGTAVITATSNLDDSFSASCTVTVNSLNITVNGTLQDAEGNPMFYSWNMENNETWTGGTAIDTSMVSATVNTHSGSYYIMDAVESSWSMHEVDAATGESITVGANNAGVPLWDMEYSSWLSTEDAPKLNAIYYYYFLPGKDPMALDTSAFGLSSYLSAYSGASMLTAITSYGYYAYTESDGSTTDTELVLMMDDAGYIWYFWIYPTADGYSAKLNYVPTDLDIQFAVDSTGNYIYSSMVVGEDGNIYLSAFTGDTNELFCLSLSEDGEMYNATRIGDVGTDVWPATVTSVTVNNADDGRSIPSIGAIETISTVELTAAELAAAKTVRTSATCAMNAASRAAKLASESEVAEDKTTVTVNVTADEAVTNGVMDITWDTEVLELVDTKSAAPYTCVIDGEGTVTFGYVALTAFEAGDAIITLNFNVKADADTTVTVNHKQMNNGAGETEEIELDIACEHSYESVVTEPTCTEDGYTTYTCALCGDSYVGDEVKALGHDFVNGECTRCDETRESTFTDVKAGDFFFDPVEWAVENGITNGATETTFNPTGNCQRGQIVTFLWRAAGEPKAENAENPFVDVKETDFYYDAVLWAVENGITNGVDATHFGPNLECNRAAVVTFLYRAMGEPEVAETESVFTDVTDPEAYYYNAVLWAVENGITTGMGDGTFGVDTVCNRAQVVTFLYRAMAK